MTEFWTLESVLGKLSVLLVLLLLLRASIPLARLAQRICFRSGPLPSLKEMDNDEVASDDLARYALTNDAPFRAGEGLSHQAPSWERVALAQLKFAHHCETSALDAVAAKQASYLICLTAFIAISLSALPTFHRIHNDSNQSGEQSLFITVKILLVTFGLELLAGAAVYFVASLLEQKLGMRRANWNYILARAKALPRYNGEG